MWEITIKLGTGKIVFPGSDVNTIIQNLGSFHIEIMPIRIGHLLALQKLPPHHKDPFDRILIAQSQAEKVSLLTVDEIIYRYPVNAIW